MRHTLATFLTLTCVFVTARAHAGPSCQLEVTDTDPVTAGENITYTVIITNVGDAASANGTLDFTVQARFLDLDTTGAPGWSCTTPPVGEFNGSIACTIPSVAVGSATFIVRASTVASEGSFDYDVTGGVYCTGETLDADNVVNDLKTHVEAADDDFDLSITGTADSEGWKPGDDVTFTLAIANLGVEPAYGVSWYMGMSPGTYFESLTGGSADWSCTLPAPGTRGPFQCNHAGLVAGFSETFALVISIDPGLGSTTLINDFGISANNRADQFPANNTLKILLPPYVPPQPDPDPEPTPEIAPEQDDDAGTGTSAGEDVSTGADGGTSAGEDASAGADASAETTKRGSSDDGCGTGAPSLVALMVFGLARRRTR